MNKKWYLSKTLWVNLIGAAALIATAFGVDSGDVAAWLGAEGILLAMVNAILRAFTNTGITR